MDFFGVGPLELFFVILVALLVLGPNRMVEVARTLGKYVREFQRASSEVPRLLSLDDDSKPSLPPRQSVSDESSQQPADGDEDGPSRT